MRSRYGDMGKKNFGQDRRKNRSRIFLPRAFPFSLSPSFSLPFFFSCPRLVCRRCSLFFLRSIGAGIVLIYFIIISQLFSSLCYFLLLFSSLFRSPSTVNATILFIIVIISIIVIVINIIVYLFIVYYYSYCYYYYHYHHIVCG